MNDELLPEYDLSALVVVERGPGYRQTAPAILLDPELAKAFPDSKSVNQALRVLLEAAQKVALK